jgi:hypothetical protein
MKKYMLMLAVALIATPAFATVTITAEDIDGTGPEGLVAINYAVTGEPNAVAAFALNIEVDAGDINDISGFHVGVSTAGDAGYGIFPANFDRFITVNGNGDVDDWAAAGYNPAADVNDKGALGGLGLDTGAITVELGALYKGGPNAPAPTGTLCIVNCTETCTLDVTLNDIRGGVVLEGAGDPQGVNLAGATDVPVDVSSGNDDCFLASDSQYNDWVAMGKPDCWCYLSHCYGDTNHTIEGNPITGYFRVHFNDLTVLINAWNVNEPPKGPGLANDPLVCADFNHAQEGNPITGYFRVHFQDLTALINSWNLAQPPKGPGVPKDCAGATLDPDA